MINKYKIILLLLLIVIIWKSFQMYVGFPQEVSNGSITDISQMPKIKISVYYEALCSDSKNFIMKQLEPTYESLSNLIELDLVPYGKAKTIDDTEISFTCQHGPTECLANKVHACVLDYVKEPSVRLKYVSCMINDNMLPVEIGEKCASELNILFDPISECFHGVKGSLLLKEYGVRTHEVRPSITFIPTVELDGSQKVPLGRVLKNLKKELCNLFQITPPQCL